MAKQSKRQLILIVMPAWYVVALSALLFTGCREPNGSYAMVSGTVTVDGQPLSGAIVTFEPLDGTPGKNASASVFDGQFQISGDAQLHGGNYLARISMMPSGILRKLPDAQRQSLPPANSVIDPAFDSNSRLRCTLAPGQENSLAFQIHFLSTR